MPHEHEKQQVALASLFAAVVLTLFKLIVGVMTNSLGILAEALHSGLDLVAAGMTLWAVRVSGKPADKDHTYGHGKFENLSALLETGLLLITCVWIVYEASERLTGANPVEVDINFWAFAVVILSIVVDYRRSRALARVAREHCSQALEADALHFSTDLWSSAVVLVGLVLVWAARETGLHWLTKADSLAALGVAGISVWVGFQLGKKSVDDLLDAVPLDLQEQIENTVQLVPGVQEVRQVRVRRSGPDLFADVTVAVVPTQTIRSAHDTAHDVEDAIRKTLPRIDVVVHVEPGHDAVAG